MAEDFVGAGGRLEEEFVHAVNPNLQTEVFVKFAERAAQSKPELVAGLEKLQAAMGEADFDKYINTVENINVSGRAMLILAGEEKIRTALTAKWLPAIKEAFGVDNVRVVGGGRGGIDAY